jgi:cobalt-precorrin-5B (C1)-methyltransferase
MVPVYPCGPATPSASAIKNDAKTTFHRAHKLICAKRKLIVYRKSMSKEEPKELRRGWTTGACATAAAKAAYQALLTGDFPDPVEITLPKGGTTAFALTRHTLSGSTASAAIIKDAGDDPDVTHGALVSATVSLLPKGTGVVFKAGDGVGTVTRPGLPIPPGEPAINPVPRQMMRTAIEEVAEQHRGAGDVEITVSIEGGAELALKTMNPRLGILGGLSVLGTTGIVRPFSCAAWIASIHRGVDVARAVGLGHVVGATGASSEDAVKARYDLDETAYLDMGDFAGGLLKYLRSHPVDRLTLAGGFAKFTKLAQGALDLHSARSSVDFSFLQDLLRQENAPTDLIEQAASANTAKEVLDASLAAGIDLSGPLARRTKMAVRQILRDAPVDVEVLITDRQGKVLGETGFDR